MVVAAWAAVVATPFATVAVAMVEVAAEAARAYHEEPFHFSGLLAKSVAVGAAGPFCHSTWAYRNQAFRIGFGSFHGSLAWVGRVFLEAY